jgi:predicted Zn finger-like uncharacterized protein
MIVTCDNCHTKFRVPDNRIPAEGTHVRCSKCHTTFWFEPEVPAHSAPTGVEVHIPTSREQRRQERAQDPNNDSWFELPTINHPAPPGAAGLALDSLGPQEPQQSEKHEMQFRDSWWGTNSLDMLMQESAEQGNDLSHMFPKDNQPPTPPDATAQAAESSIFGDDLGLEDLATTSHFDPSYPELNRKRPEDVKLEVPGAPKPQAPRPQIRLQQQSSPDIDQAALASVRQPAEFLLLDTSQQKEELLYSAIPTAIRTALLVFLLLLFSGLWTYVDQGRTNNQPFTWKALKQTFFGNSSYWRLEGLHIRQIHVGQQNVLAVSGSLKNTSEQPQSTPDLTLYGFGDQQGLVKARFACCHTYKGSLRNGAILHNYFARRYNKRTNIKPNGKQPFSIYLPSKRPFHTLELRVTARRKDSPTLRKVKRTRKRKPTPRPSMTKQPPKTKPKKRRKKQRRRRRRRRKKRR